MEMVIMSNCIVVLWGLNKFMYTRHPLCSTRSWGLNFRLTVKLKIRHRLHQAPVLVIYFFFLFIFFNDVDVSMYVCMYVFICLFIYLWLCWVFISVRGPSLVAASGGHSSSRCAGLSLSRPLLLRSTGSRRAGSVIVAHGPSCAAACGIFPDQGSNPCPLHWQADSQPLRHQGSPWLSLRKFAGQASWHTKQHGSSPIFPRYSSQCPGHPAHWVCGITRGKVD